MEIRFTLRALTDLDEIHSYIARDNQERADRLVEALRDALDVLTVFPESGSTRANLPEGLRVFVYRNYLTIYSIGDDAILIEGITEGHRDIGGLFSDS